jgi:positive regulator of sigma E activity
LAGAGLSVVVVVVDLEERAALDLLVLLAMAMGLGLLVFLEGAAARREGEERAAFALVAGLAFLMVAAFFDDLATETPTPLIALNATTFADRKQSGFTAS